MSLKLLIISSAVGKALGSKLGLDKRYIPIYACQRFGKVVEHCFERFVYLFLFGCTLYSNSIAKNPNSADHYPELFKLLWGFITFPDQNYHLKSTFIKYIHFFL